MSTAKTSSAIATHLESAITSIAEVNSAISGIYSSVMGRDDARITGIDTRMSLKQELKNNVAMHIPHRTLGARSLPLTSGLCMRAGVPTDT